MQLCLKIFSGMANSVDPDQDLGLLCLDFVSATFVYKILGYIPYPKIRESSFCDKCKK